MSKHSFKHQQAAASRRFPWICGLRVALRVASLCAVILLVVFWVYLGQLSSKHQGTTELDDLRDTALRRIFGEHGEEIQGAIRDNWHWFRDYLAKLRHSSRAGSLAAGDDDDEEETHRSAMETTMEVKPAAAAGDPSDPSEPSTKAAAKQEDRSKASGDASSSNSGAQASRKAGPGHKAAAQAVLGTLNNLDMPMHKVHGKMEPCLKLLPEAELEQLQVQEPRSRAVPQSTSRGVTGSRQQLKYYRMDEDAREIEEAGGMVDKGTSLAQEQFAGKQTMGERAESYTIQDGMEVHCGFAGQDTGFDISAGDQRHLEQCRVAVVTAAFGGGDMLAQPIGMLNATLGKVCYVAFWDDVTLKAQAEEGVVPDPVTRHVGLWRIVLVKNLPFVDQRRNGKVPKILTHRLFPNALYSIWVDSKLQFRRDPLGVLESLLWRRGEVFAISEHGARSCIYAEGEAIVRKHKASPEEVAIQLNQYRAEGLPVNATFNGHKALAEASVIVREHNFETNLFMCLWFNEMVRFTSRDQLSFGYVLRRMNLLKPYMFPVCTRRALVNKLGHKRKAKPLIRTS